MADSDHRFIERIETPGVVEQLNSVNPRVSRKKEDSRQPTPQQRRRPSVEQILEEEKEQSQDDVDDGHIDIHA